MPPLKRKASTASTKSSNAIIASEALNHLHFKHVKNLQIILCRQYFKQLKLDYPVTFTADPDNKLPLDVNVFEVDVRMKKDVMALRREGRHDIFLHLVNKLASSNRFVGLTILEALLELILVSDSVSSFVFCIRCKVLI